MRSARWVLLSFLLLPFADAVVAQKVASSNPSPPEEKAPSTITPDAVKAGAAIHPVSLGTVTAGAKISLPDFGEKPSSITDLEVDIRSVAKPDPPIATPSVTREDGSLRLTLPPHLESGQYYFTLKDKTVIPGVFEIAPEKIKLTAVYPHPGSHDDFNFLLEGENFSTDPSNDDVTAEGRGSLVEKKGTETECDSLPACLWVKNDHEMHLMHYSAKNRYGPLTVGVTVRSTHATDERRVVLPRFSGATLSTMSAVFTGLLFGAVSWIVSAGLKNNKVGIRKLSLWQTFIFDPETSSYSLSKFQVLAFSITFIFGYFYVLLSQWFVQWQFMQPDIPPAIAGLLGISGGTAVASAGLTAARGAKGSGLEQPTGADLVSIGGVVVPERFQFFTWTIVFCGGFLALLIGRDPATVTGFPELPTGLLYIMGVSATGYLAGKAARKPGPILEYVGVERVTIQEQTAPVPNTGPPPHLALNLKPAPSDYWVLTAQGQNLGSDGRFFIGEKELDIASEKDKLANGFKSDEKLVKSIPQVGAADPAFNIELKISVLNPEASGLLTNRANNPVKFRIVNRDGQFAEIRTPDVAPVPALSSVPAIEQEPDQAEKDSKESGTFGTADTKAPVEKDSVIGGAPPFGPKGDPDLDTPSQPDTLHEK